jgi:hypothetical protein
VSAADFLLAPEVQKLLKVAYAGAESRFSVKALAQATRLEEGDVERTVEHLAASGILTRHNAQGDQPEAFSVNARFVFHDELRSIALKSFAAAEPLRSMLRSRFKDSVLRAFVLGEDAAGTIEVLIVHGQTAPEQAAMSQAIHKLSKAIGRNLAVQVITHARYSALGARDPLHARLAARSVLEIIKPGDSKARVPVEKTGLFHSAKKKLAALAR